MTKQFKHGMVLGKFMPPHNGHLYLINYALNYCDVVELFVCSLKSEPIEGRLRYNWLKEIYEGVEGLNIHWVQDENPQSPEEHADFDDFYRIWCETVNSRTSNLDVIFTSEDYGFEFADKLGIEHKLVDIKRETVPISGTAIRNNPFKNWEFIPPIVRPYFKKKVVIMGPESTGKTTLTNKLANHFNGGIIEEFGREYTENKSTESLEMSDFESIALTHNMKINAHMKYQDSKLLFIDTEAITTHLFGKLYLGESFNSDLINSIIKSQTFDLILLCTPEVEGIQDGSRDYLHYREEHFEMIKSFLDEREIPYQIISSSDYDKRFEMAVEKINELNLDIN